MSHVVMTAAEEVENLREMVIMLNDASNRIDDWKRKGWSHDEAIRLRRFVLAWNDSGGCNLRKMKLEPRDLERVNRFVEGCHVTTDQDGSLRLVDYYHQGNVAAMHFSRWIRNSQRERLRPPCTRCEKWYVSQTQRKKRFFCSRKCAGGAAKAAERNRKKNRLLEKAKRVIERYPSRPARFEKIPWKEYVSEATGISKKFLTLAVDHGELTSVAESKEPESQKRPRG